MIEGGSVVSPVVGAFMRFNWQVSVVEGPFRLRGGPPGLSPA